MWLIGPLIPSACDELSSLIVVRRGWTDGNDLRLPHDNETVAACVGLSCYSLGKTDCICALSKYVALQLLMLCFTLAHRRSGLPVQSIVNIHDKRLHLIHRRNRNGIAMQAVEGL